MERRTKSTLLLLVLGLGLLAPLPPSKAETATSWAGAKNRSDDHVYDVHRFTFYCGCDYVSDNDSDGSGDVDRTGCGLVPLPLKPDTADRIQWEHIVPAALMPAHEFACWTNPERFEGCIAPNSDVFSGRSCCERISPTAQSMLFDLHNLAPSVGQVNQYRQNDRYGQVTENFESWAGCDARDQHGVTPDPTGNARFEPPDCVKGDAARVWLYMQERHGVQIPQEEYEMFLQWSENDPVSPWELERDGRIFAVQGNHNPYVADHVPDPGGACPWE